MVNAPTISAAGCQHQAWSQRAKYSTCNAASRFCRNSRSGSVGAAPARQVCQHRVPTKCSAAPDSSGSDSSCSRNEIQLVKGSGSNRTCRRLPASLAELLETTSCRLVEMTASLILMTQPLPAQAGEIIQGMPRVSDGDTLQVQPSTQFQCYAAWPQAA